MKQLILGSSSPYRADLLGKIAESFLQIKPEINEEKRPNEPATLLANRLAKQKALAVLDRYPSEQACVIIGSDQVCYLPATSSTPEITLNKPGNMDKALDMLCQCSGKKVFYHTAAYVIDTEGHQHQAFDCSYALEFRNFNREDARRYCLLDKPFDCAGAIKSESFGVNLIEAHHGHDPSSLIGLPLIQLRKVLLSMGISCR